MYSVYHSGLTWIMDTVHTKENLVCCHSGSFSLFWGKGGGGNGYLKLAVTLQNR